MHFEILGLRFMLLLNPATGGIAPDGDMDMLIQHLSQGGMPLTLSSEKLYRQWQCSILCQGWGHCLLLHPAMDRKGLHPQKDNFIRAFV